MKNKMHFPQEDSTKKGFTNQKLIVLVAILSVVFFIIWMALVFPVKS